MQHKLRLRVVGVRHPKTGELHLYPTNLPPKWMTPEQIRVAYSARWVVELLFDWLNNGSGMKRFPSKRMEVVQALLHFLRREEILTRLYCGGPSVGSYRSLGRQ